MKAICNNEIYTQKVIGQLLGLYYLVSQKSYSEDKNIWKLALTVIYP